MQFGLQLLPALIGLLATGTDAAVARSNNVARATTGTVHVCTDIDFSGTCADIPFTNGVCVNFNSTYNDEISSISAGTGITCTFFVNSGCVSGQGQITIYQPPGIDDLTQYEGLNDALSSVQCFNHN